MAGLSGALSAFQWNTDKLQQRLAVTLTVLLVVLVAWSAAQLTWLLVPEPDTGRPPIQESVQPANSRDDSSDRAEAIRHWHLFGQAEELDGDQDAPADAPETRLDLELRGIIHTPDTGQARALIDGGDSNKQAYAVDESIRNNVHVEAIYSDRVILQRGQAYEALPLATERVSLGGAFAEAGNTGNNEDQQQNVTSESGTTSAAGSSDDETRADQAEQLSQVMRMQPAMADGEMIGLRVEPTGDPEQFRALGLQSGDIVTAVGGRDVDRPDAAMSALENLTADDFPLRLQIRRDGEEQQIEIAPD